MQLTDLSILYFVSIKMVQKLPFTKLTVMSLDVFMSDQQSKTQKYTI